VKSVGCRPRAIRSRPRRNRDRTSLTLYTSNETRKTQNRRKNARDNNPITSCSANEIEVRRRVFFRCTRRKGKYGTPSTQTDGPQTGNKNKSVCGVCRVRTCSRKTQDRPQRGVRARISDALSFLHSKF